MMRFTFKRQSQSIKRRLFVSACVVLCLFLGGTGVVLNQAFSLGLKDTIREKLRLHTYAIISIAEVEGGQMLIPPRLTDRRFNEAGGSLLAFVSDQKGLVVWQSASSKGRDLVAPRPNRGEWLYGRFKDAGGDLFLTISYNTSWPGLGGQKLNYDFTVMENIRYYTEQLTNYQRSLIITLSLIGALLLVLQGIIFYWGLGPVRRLASDVEAMNQGEEEDLQGNYPSELSPLVANLNLLIANERRQRERFRNTLADLSHSLKTPLAVLRGVQSDINPDGTPISRERILSTLDKQVSKMGEIIDYQLQRAVVGQAELSFVALPIKPEVFSILNAMGKVYVDKSVKPIVNIDPDLQFYGDVNDLVEILGNLLDNAYKYCKQQVMLSIAKSAPLDESKTAEQPASWLMMAVEDDGPGIPAGKRAAILKRGVRLDSRAEGQGIGLSIVVDIIESYKGTIEIRDSSLGGSKMVVNLPARK